MAAVIINRRRESVFGSKRAILLNVNVTNTGDTFDPSNAMRALDVALADAAGTTVVNCRDQGADYLHVFRRRQPKQRGRADHRKLIWQKLQFAGAMQSSGTIAPG